MSSIQWLIVGAGFTGTTLAQQIATVRNERVLVIDQRDHIAGNAYDHLDASGVLVHRYGPHIFHTNSKKIWDYLSAFTQWRPYFHKVMGSVDGQLVPIPFNLNSIDALFPRTMADRLGAKLIERYGWGRKVPILKMREESDPDILFIANFAYEKIFENYTLKQWDLTPEDLDPGVTARVPVHVSRDDRYFQDRYQAMPKHGYTAMFEKMLDHPLIEIALSTSWKSIQAQYPDAKVIFTGPIDEFFDYRHGPLPYRSLRFEQSVEPVSGLNQPCGTVNYPNEFDFTRITEMKWLTGQQHDSTLLIAEHSQAYVPGENEPYYPIPRPETSALLAPYLADARALAGKVWFAGRLGDYAYYNMDQACGRALTLFEKSLNTGSPTS
jgi:UDP-galactopyranose mutase